MIAMAGLIASGRKALVKLENAVGFLDSPLCHLIRDLVSAGGGGSVAWVGYAVHQRFPVNGNRAQLFLANEESKHLLPGIEADLVAGVPAARMVLADVLRREGCARAVSPELVYVKDKLPHGGAGDAPSRIGVLRDAYGAFAGVVYSADADTAVAARGRVARTSLKAL
jgi:hypothetical protein